MYSPTKTKTSNVNLKSGRPEAELKVNLKNAGTLKNGDAYVGGGILYSDAYNKSVEKPTKETAKHLFIETR